MSPLGVVLGYLLGVVLAVFFTTAIGRDRATVAYASFFWPLFLIMIVVYCFFEMVWLYGKTVFHRIQAQRP